MTGTIRVVVLGGGILGVSTAAHLARRGAEVVLVTESDLGSGASGRSLSWLNSFGGQRSAEYHHLRALGLDRYRSFSSRVPESADYLRFDGGLTWPAAGDAGTHTTAFQHMRRTGYDAHWLSPGEIAEWTPGVDAGAVAPEGAVFNPGEGWVELPPLISHLAADFVKHGGEILSGKGPASVDAGHGRARAVVTGAGERLDADAVLVATGADVPKMLRGFDLEITDATPLSLLVRTAPAATSLRAVLNTPRVAVRPTPDGGLVMDSDEAAQEIITNDDGTYEVRDETVRSLMHEASAVLLGNPELTLASYGVGRKPIPGDGEPVLGEVKQVPGLHVAFTHSGATLGLIAGELLAREIYDGVPSPLLDAFRPARFN
jgi:glycine/D-amino acid oxidase-like deaminating enzyme